MAECTYPRLREILLGLGYKDKTFDKDDGGHLTVFQHAEAHSRLFIDHYPDEDRVSPTTLAIVRYNLDMRGIITREQFEDLLRERSLAG